MQISYQPLYRKHSFLDRQIIPCMVCLHSAASDSWVDGQSWARGPNLGHLWIVFIESIVIEHYVVFRFDFLCVTSDLRVQCPRVLLEGKI